EFLSFRGLSTKQRTAGIQEVGPRKEKVAINQKVLLLGTRGCRNSGGVLVSEEFKNSLGLLVQRLHRTQQWCFLVQGLACPRHEGSGNAQCRSVGIFQNVGRACDIPRRIAAGFECRANAAGGETGCIRLPLDQLLARKLGDSTSLTVRFNE